jgi:hypothetical protein
MTFVGRVCLSKDAFLETLLQTFGNVLKIPPPDRISPWGVEFLSVYKTDSAIAPGAH